MWERAAVLTDRSGRYRTRCVQIANARTQPLRPTLDSADILDTILGDVDSDDDHLIEDAIMTHTANTN